MTTDCLMDTSSNLTHMFRSISSQDCKEWPCAHRCGFICASDILGEEAVNAFIEKHDIDESRMAIHRRDDGIFVFRAMLNGMIRMADPDFHSRVYNNNCDQCEDEERFIEDILAAMKRLKRPANARSI